MGLSLNEFYTKFDAFIRQSNDEVMKIFAENHAKHIMLQIK